jgi:RNA polymerase sigma factor (TIGR02999 family)
MGDPTQQITLYLRRMRDGDAAAADEMLPLLYDDLRGLAGGFLRGGAGHTLQPTALVHEAWIKIDRALDRGAEIRDRRHFLAVASRAMRQVLVNHVRDRRAQKRGGGASRVPLDDCVDLIEARTGDLADLDDLLQRFAAEHPRPARIVEMRVFGGMTVEEVGEVLDLSPTTVKADWRFGRAWLRSALPPDAG